MTERYVSPVALPEGLDRELLTILVEECLEVGQRATKMLRFGATEVQPGQDLDNIDRLSLEIGDLTNVLDRLLRRGLVREETVVRGCEHKDKQLDKFLQHYD